MNVQNFDYDCSVFYYGVYTFQSELLLIFNRFFDHRHFMQTYFYNENITHLKDDRFSSFFIGLLKNQMILCISYDLFLTRVFG